MLGVLELKPLMEVGNLAESALDGTASDLKPGN